MYNLSARRSAVYASLVYSGKIQRLKLAREHGMSPRALSSVSHVVQGLKRTKQIMQPIEHYTYQDGSAMFLTGVSLGSQADIHVFLVLSDMS